MIWPRRTVRKHRNVGITTLVIIERIYLVEDWRKKRIPTHFVAFCRPCGEVHAMGRTLCVPCHKAWLEENMPKAPTE